MEIGMWFVSDLYRANQIIPFREWERCGINSKDYWFWFQMINAIPNNWRLHLKQEVHEQVEGIGDSHRSKKSKQFYDIFMKNKFEISKGRNKFTDLFNLSEQDWMHIYHKIWDGMYDQKVKEFQFKVVHNIVATNKLLKKMGLVGSEDCNFCQEETGTLFHLLIECPHVQQFWEAMEGWLNSKNYGVNLLPKNLIFGLDTDEAVNHIFMLAKYFIFKCHMEQTLPRFHVFMLRLKSHIRIEHEIYKIKGQITKFTEKWKKNWHIWYLNNHEKN